ncbi:MAG: hypothetical protein JSW00_12840 [Thermoplasmata archaeon]|nr:MAG: hypothetical protein JSW00_12840 [Thermoplasmata archaeon]
MFRKMGLRMGSIFFAGIFLCVIIAGVVEAAEVKERNDVEVASSETEIIEGTYTHKWHNRIFRINNGEHQIIATVWGSNDEQTWEYFDSSTIDPGKSDTMVMGLNHFWYVKLTGRTTDVHATPSIVDASLTYHIP